ncbi:MAG: hypothetical protein U0800_18390 [Isosphaeraceae bacterium]
MSYAILAPAPIHRTREEPHPFEGIAPILISLPSVERRPRPQARKGPRRRLRREVRGLLWVLLGIGLGWSISTHRQVPIAKDSGDEGPILVRLSIEDEPSMPPPTEETHPIALKGFILPSETR